MSSGWASVQLDKSAVYSSVVLESSGGDTDTDSATVLGTFLATFAGSFGAECEIPFVCYYYSSAERSGTKTPVFVCAVE